MVTINNVFPRFRQIKGIQVENLVTWVALACSICGLVWSWFLYYSLGSCVTVYIPACFTVIIIPIVIWNQYRKSDKFLLWALCLCIILVPWAIELSLGTTYSCGVMLWGMIAPLLSFFYLRYEYSFGLFALLVVCMLISGITGVQLTNDYKFADAIFVRLFSTLNEVFPTLIVCGAVFMLVWVGRKKTSLIDELYKDVRVKHKDVMDSITYAESLQTSILPKHEDFQKSFPKSFLLHRPRDIVSGDFFWHKSVGDAYYFAVADATGHGVPGAMVSVLCNYALDQTIELYGCTDPGRILHKSKELVLEMLHFGKTGVKDGMDVALCYLNKGFIHFSGARQSLYLLRKGNADVEVYKGARQSVGYSVGQREFTTHIILVRPGDRYYLSSDGLFDQFGGENDKKFGRQRFMEIIQGLADVAIEQQDYLLSVKLDKWMTGYHQIDDICVIGVEL